MPEFQIEFDVVDWAEIGESYRYGQQVEQGGGVRSAHRAG